MNLVHDARAAALVRQACGGRTCNQFWLIGIVVAVADIDAVAVELLRLIHVQAQRRVPVPVDVPLGARV